ncbi:Sodium:alanine symporter family [Corynebacterium epidermidicanis]|uniref:Sodium:alanine symporter family n=1 Tax=Corynebacterium epidermidicanis TaxID=1050174 RepID=A0A0G3GRG7_9CORY|nr:Sodium:alanine symporter family [Corynebacterium epidermidicanis]
MSQSGSIDAAIQGVFGPFVDVLETVVFYAIPIGDAQVPLVILWLLCGGLFLTFWLRVRPFKDAMQTLRIIRGHMSRHDDPGEVTSFQAMATELAGTIGLGNIAGVAVAITMGGPGAALWIMIAGVLGMAVKLAEATLSQMFRRVNDDGSIAGGPMYYLTDGLASIGKPKLGKALGFIFAFCFMIAAMGAGNIFQSNQIAVHLIEASWVLFRFLYGGQLADPGVIIHIDDLCRALISEGFVEALVVPPVDPVQRRKLDLGQ